MSGDFSPYCTLKVNTKVPVKKSSGESYDKVQYTSYIFRTVYHARAATGDKAAKAIQTWSLRLDFEK